ncbi:MAG TPA: twin-arginine translocase TatA/TatE family subunit [Terracidiphilus sp.]|jgi:sec-independent protein translocase protein TatB
MSAHPPILFGTLGMTDSLILMVMALVVFGPRRLPQIGRQIGKLMYEFRKASNDFKFQMEEELRNSEEVERRKKEEERQRVLAAQTTAEQASVSADPPIAEKPAESPYPGEGTYPQQYPLENSDADLKAEEGTPRIMPPSTGETVAAARPARAPEFPEEQLAKAEPPNTPEASGAENSTQKPNTPSEAAEALNQHG